MIDNQLFNKKWRKINVNKHKSFAIFKKIISKNALIEVEAAL